MTETPWFEEIFDDHAAASIYLVDKVCELRTRGYTFREVELRHEMLFEGFGKPHNGADRWRVFIRVLPLT